MTSTIIKTRTLREICEGIDLGKQIAIGGKKKHTVEVMCYRIGYETGRKYEVKETTINDQQVVTVKRTK